MSPVPTSTPTPAHAAVLQARSAILRRAFTYLRTAAGRPGARAALLVALEQVHRRNVETLGLTQAETLRAHAWCEVVDAEIPVPDVADSDMAQFIAAGGAVRDDPYDDSGVAREHL